MDGVLGYLLSILLMHIKYTFDFLFLSKWFTWPKNYFQIFLIHPPCSLFIISCKKPVNSYLSPVCFSFKYIYLYVKIWLQRTSDLHRIYLIEQAILSSLQFQCTWGKIIKLIFLDFINIPHFNRWDSSNPIFLRYIHQLCQT